MLTLKGSKRLPLNLDAILKCAPSVVSPYAGIYPCFPGRNLLRSFGYGQCFGTPSKHIYSDSTTQDNTGARKQDSGPCPRQDG